MKIIGLAIAKILAGTFDRRLSVHKSRNLHVIFHTLSKENREPLSRLHLQQKYEKNKIGKPMTTIVKNKS